MSRGVGYRRWKAKRMSPPPSGKNPDVFAFTTPIKPLSSIAIAGKGRLIRTLRRRNTALAARPTNATPPGGSVPPADRLVLEGERLDPGAFCPPQGCFHSAGRTTAPGIDHAENGRPVFPVPYPPCGESHHGARRNHGPGLPRRGTW